MKFRFVAGALCLAGAFFLLCGSAHALKSAREIDASVAVALDEVHRYVPGSEAFLDQAAGVLVLPNVYKGAFIVGAEYGKGAMLVNGTTVGYYNMIAGSVGFQFGGQAKDIIIAFMTQNALDRFRASKGWEAGVDGNIAVLTIGAGESLSTLKTQEPIVAFVYDVKGLLIDASLKGAKFTKINPEP